MFAVSQLADSRAPFKFDPLGASPVSTNNNGHIGSSRRAILARSQPGLAATLDEIDYGMLPLTDAAHAIQANHAARLELDGTRPLPLQGDELRARRAKEAPPLAQALRAAARRVLRKLLTLGEGAQHQMVNEAYWARSPRTEMPASDPLEHLRAAELADITLLYMVVCAAAATLVLATATAVLA